MDKREMLTSSDVAAMCGVTTVTVQRWIRAGYFPGAWKGLGKTSPYHIPKDEVEAFIERMSEGVQEEWLKRYAEVQPEPRTRKRKAAPAEDQQGQPDQRAVAAALTEMLQQFKGRQAEGSLALIVEDDPDAGSIFEFTLRSAGFATNVVESGGAALKWLASMAPDVVVLDLHLPDMPGTEILHQMRGSPELAEVPVIVATAHPEMAESIQDEADLVLVKPVRYKVLQGKAVELAGGQ